MRPGAVLPEDLRMALRGAPAIRAAFDALSPSHRRQYVRWVDEAKRPETRAKRITKALEMISERTARAAR